MTPEEFNIKCAELKAEIARLKVSRDAALSREQEANRNWSSDAKKWIIERNSIEAKHREEMLGLLDEIADAYHNDVHDLDYVIDGLKQRIGDSDE